jgi:hypothetical protein
LSGWREILAGEIAEIRYERGFIALLRKPRINPPKVAVEPDMKRRFTVLVRCSGTSLRRPCRIPLRRARRIRQRLPLCPWKPTYVALHQVTLRPRSDIDFLVSLRVSIQVRTLSSGVNLPSTSA